MGQIELFHFEAGKPSFEDYGMENGFRYWFARDLMGMLGYKDFGAFKKAINKAMAACAALNIDIQDNFVQINRVVDGTEVSDFKLSKFGCYLTAMNGDSKKPEVAAAQAYFITLAEAFKKYINEAEDVDRVRIRDELSQHEKSLAGAANDAGVINYALFQNSGYRGLYNMDMSKLKNIKGVPASRSPLDFMGKEELAANLFRITQTEAKIRNESVRGQRNLERTAYSVGFKVRQTMEEISGTNPESLPPAQDIRQVQSALKTAHKGFKAIEKKEKV
ncbi:BRO family protein [Azospirillum soli]|uniref:BRO family protein n=1 Tax=Azospirillum soli TaxID=1304799 RepID=UPI001AE4A0BB|nr:BRO family protein [Azospirillum soli]MBP2316948.1 DNA-damage-inducible protein D [Azospirillum soli]